MKKNKEKPNVITFHERLPTLDQMSELLIAEALKRANGNQSAAAKMLGISRKCVKKHTMDAWSNNSKILLGSKDRHKPHLC